MTLRERPIMGETRPTTRTLPTGEKVTHYPDGRQVLQPPVVSSFLSKMDGEQESNREKLEELQQKSLEAVQAKIVSLEEGDPVPSDKRPL